MSKIATDHEDSMNFEYTMMLLFGENAYQIVTFAKNEKYVKEWLKKAIAKMKKDINSLDTTERHKEILIYELTRIDKELTKGNVWEIIYSLFNFSIRLLGYDYHRAQRLLTPSYSQTVQQRFWSGLQEGEDWKKHAEQRKSFIRKRAELIKKLKEENYTTFEISQIFNTTDYHVKKILKEIETDSEI
jgi:hypothetical protein